MPIVRDAVPITSRVVTPEGFLSVQAAVTRTGIITYDASELGLTDRTGPVRVMRTPESVFHKDTIASVRDAVVTMEHPDSFVDPGNWKQVAIGNTAGDPAPLNDGIRLGAGLIIRDKAGIDAIQSGKDEISIGYSMNLIPVQGAAYDFRTDGPMPVNHIAATETGRAGPEVRVFDQEGTMTTPNTGLNEETLAAIGAMVSKAVTDALPKPEAPGQTVSAQNIDPDAIAKSVMAGMKPVMDSLGEVAKGMADAQQKQDEETARKNAQDAADKLIANTLGEERARVAVLDQARNFIPAEKLESLREAPVKDILVAAVGDSVTDAANQSEEVLRGALMVMASQNQGRQDVANLRQSTGIVGDAVRKGNAYDQYVKSMTDAWKTPINANTGS